MGVQHRVRSCRDYICLTADLSNMNMIPLLSIALLGLVSSAPQSGRSFPNNNQNSPNTNTRFFTGNQALDSAAAGAALGLAGQYISNQIFNPCRSGNRGGNRNQQGTNNRIFGNSNIGNGLLGLLGGFAAGSIINNA